ncbi:MAG TPA: LLM class flavin-dependent oxidoreductase [Chloroflexota bacterium]
MEVQFNWHVPCGGDGRWMAQWMPERLPHVDYLQQVAVAAETVGFDRVLVPCAFSNGNYSLAAPYVDSWTLGTALMAATRKIEILVAHRPGFINPGVFAQMCATADDFSAGRLALNIVTAGAPGDMEQFGDVLDHDARYRRASEFVDVLKSLWTQEETNFDGEFYCMQRAGLSPKPVQAGGPRFFLAGASESAIDMAAKQADVYMMSASTVENIGARIADVRARAAAVGRTVQFCVAATMFAADTDEEARRWATDFVSRADLEVVAERTRLGRMTTSVEDLRARAGTNMHTWLTPNIWSGMVHLTYGAAWVGSYTDIAALFEQYAHAGVNIFQIYGYPFLEEAYHVGERLLPVVKKRLAAV